MVFPHYLISVSLVFGLLAIGSYIYQQSNDQNQSKQHSTNEPGYDTRYDFNYSAIDNCSICLEELQPPIQYLPCTHKLHQTCYLRLIRSEKRCPECRYSFAA